MFILRDGTVFKGEFKNGYADGEGSLKHQNGNIENGIWNQGKLRS